MRKTFHYTCLAAMLLFGAMPAIFSRAQAADRWWDTSNGAGLQGANGSWNLADGNWNTSATPGGNGRVNWTNSNTAIFEANASGTGTITVSGTVQVDAITFNGTGFSVEGTTLTMLGSNLTANVGATINAPLGGSVGLTKLGTANLSLGGSNAYSGVTTVSGGTLSLTASSSGNSISSSTSIVVGSGATLSVTGLNSGSLNLAGTQALSGSGTVRGGLNASSGSTIRPGSGTGQMTFTGAGGVTLATGSTLELEIGAPGSSDSLVINGDAGTKTFTPGNATLKLVGLSGIQTATPYTIVSTSGSGTINAASFFKNADLAGTVMSSNATTYSQSGLSFTINQTSSAITVTFSAVPEPSTLGLAMFAAPIFLRRRRRA